MNAAAVRGYDRLAGAYRTLEQLAFGSALMRARTAHLDALAGCRRVLIVGEGDGRFVHALLSRYPTVEAVCVDLSPAMARRARARLGALGSRARFVVTDAIEGPLPAGPFDAVVTLFFLDLFGEGSLRRVLDRLAGRLAETGVWLVADFRLPDRGPLRAVARAALWALYRFFRWQTAIETLRLVDPEPALERLGLRCASRRALLGGMLRSDVFRRI